MHDGPSLKQFRDTIQTLYIICRVDVVNTGIYIATYVHGYYNYTDTYTTEVSSTRVKNVLNSIYMCTCLEALIECT